MTKYATMNPLGSTSPYDLFDNAQNFDIAINSITAAIWQDRFGKSRHTWFGLEAMAKAAIAAFGYITMDSFQAGATLTLINQVLRDTSTGEYYRWDGVFPKAVPPGSTPASSGGIGIGAWLSVGDATLRGNLAAPDIGAKLIATKQSFTGAIARTQHDKNADIIDLRDFVGVFDGTDQADNVQKALDAAAGRTLRLPGDGGQAGVSRTMLIRAGTKIISEGKYDNWDANPLTGFRFVTAGAGNPQRWTDITGSDAADDTPMFVACGNGVVVGEGVTFITTSSNWSVGVLFPCVKQCAFHGQAFGFTDGCVYLDATWSDRNSTLKALHPDVNPSTGMNEFYMNGAWCIASGAGFGLKIQGTTRAGDSVASAADWLWGWGGTSDIRIYNCRLSGTGDNGGSFSHDAQLYGINVFAQGVTLRDCGLRLSGSAKYMAKLDRSNRIIFDGCYGENTGSTTAEFAVTSRTKASTDGIMRVNDKINATITMDGVATLAVGSNAPWAETRCVITKSTTGKEWTPVLDGGTGSNQPVRVKSFASNGIMYLSSDDGIAVTDNVYIDKNLIRPAMAAGLSLGSGAFPFNNVISNKSTIPQRNFNATIIDTFGGGSPEGVITGTKGSTYRRTDGTAGTCFYVKESGTGNTGWVAK